jgi:lipopolysaccharide/colanic/teichoic acid biosynthesis glycosyltransferase
MSLKVLILDASVAYGGSAARSVLTLPLGADTVFTQLRRQLRVFEPFDVLVRACHPEDSNWMTRLSAVVDSSATIVNSEELAERLGSLETSDLVLVVQSRFWPVAGHEAAAEEALSPYRGATHVVAVGSANTEAIRERVECDSQGYVRRVQRFYDAVNWPESATSTIVYSMVPCRTTAELSFATLAELRSGLAQKGMLSRDVPLRSLVIDLTREREFLALNERLITGKDWHDHVSWPMDRSGVVSAPEARIHPCTRLVAPVVVQPDAVLERGATVIGPAVIGRGCHIGRDATVVQCVVDQSVVVADRARLRHQVVGPEAEGKGRRASEPSPPSAYGQLAGCLMAPEAATCTEDDLQPGRRRIDHVLKRALDVVLSGAALVILAPVMAAIAILVKLDSAGPVLFTHRREGRQGEEFPCWKFRTMVADAHQKQRDLYEVNQVDGPQFKLRDDPRITRVGQWLRATNLDELPQLLNVLLGHMSLVGPRPSPFRENQICVPWRRARLSVRPGITGLWQVCRSQDRSQGDFHEWIYYDVNYVRYFSVWLDVKILLATVITLGGKWGISQGAIIPSVSRREVSF